MNKIVEKDNVIKLLLQLKRKLNKAEAKAHHIFSIDKAIIAKYPIAFIGTRHEFCKKQGLGDFNKFSDTGIICISSLDQVIGRRFGDIIVDYSWINLSKHLRLICEAWLRVRAA